MRKRLIHHDSQIAVFNVEVYTMSTKWLWLTLLVGCSCLAQQTPPPVAIKPDGNDLLTLSWASESNELYRVLFKTDLLQPQGSVLKEDYFATPPSNSVKISRGSVPSAFFYVDVQTFLQSDIPYEILYPETSLYGPDIITGQYFSRPSFVGDFCVTNQVQFESLKEELGLAEHTFDFSSEVLIGKMDPVTASISGSFQLDSVRETQSAVLVVYDYIMYTPYVLASLGKDMLVVKTEHRNKPVRLVLNRVIAPYWEEFNLDIILFLDPPQIPFVSP